jgi:hypothetical protein
VCAHEDDQGECNGMEAPEVDLDREAVVCANYKKREAPSE